MGQKVSTSQRRAQNLNKLSMGELESINQYSVPNTKDQPGESPKKGKTFEITYLKIKFTDSNGQSEAKEVGRVKEPRKDGEPR